MILEHINDIAAICAGHHIDMAVISPGSRSAPLTLAFARHPDIRTKVVADERAAAFIALGIAQQQQKPVALICTSGSAAFNYAPAIAEAYFQQIPLLVLTADRPPEWIDQFDGQTIRQQGIYGNHVKGSYQYPDQVNHPDIAWHGNRLMNEAILQSTDLPMGPVHVNIPFREPFYPQEDERTLFRKVRIIEKEQPRLSLADNSWTRLLDSWNNCSNRLIIGGQDNSDPSIIAALSQLSKKGIPVVADVISNLHEVERAITHPDAFLAPGLDEQNATLSPELLITFGKSNISKNLKRFIRSHTPSQHWHIQPHERYQDTFQSLTELISIHPTDFFEQLNQKVTAGSIAYHNQWTQRNQAVSDFHTCFFAKSAFGEFGAVKTVIHHLPENAQLHLANSMSVRYANFIGLSGKKGTSVYCNRGTSGIDGSNSTALGAALESGEMVTLITGDMAFFYDRNAFWHDHIPHNLRIVILNNHAGGIFRLIKGPADQEELEEYFETRQALNAANTSLDFQMAYHKATNEQELALCLEDFFEESSQAKILEIETDSTKNALQFKEYKQGIAAILSQT